MRGAITFPLRSRLGVALAIALVVALMAPVGAWATAPESESSPSHPRLLFDATEVAVLRERVEAGMPGALWANLRHKAEAYIDPTAARYANPQEPNTGGQNIQGTYLTDLAFAYILSGDERYGRHVVEMLLGLAARNWPAWNSNELGRGDLTKGVALAFDWTYDLMTAAERDTIVASLVAGLPKLNQNGEPRQGPGFSGVFSCLNRDHPWLDDGYNNWLGVCGGGNGLALLAIAGENGAPDLTPWLTVAKARVSRYLEYGFGALGDGAEGHVYAAYGLHNALPFTVALERLTGDDLIGAAPGVTNLVEWLAFEQLPGWGSRWAPRNDAGNVGPLMAEILPFYFAFRPGDGMVGWVWDQTLGPDGDDIAVFNDQELDNPAWPGDTSCAIPLDRLDEVPVWTLFCARSAEVFNILYYRSAGELPRVSPADVLPNARHYPEFGLANFRTGWGGTNALALTFEAKRQARGHSQLDAGNFTIYGYDAMFAVDSGYGHNYSCAGNLAAQLAFGCTDTDPMIDGGRAIGHNVVLVDASKHSQGGAGRLTTAQTITEFATGQHLALARSDLHRHYANATFGLARWAERDFLVRDLPGEPVLVVVADHMRRSDQDHTYQWTMHTDAENLVTFDAGLGEGVPGLPVPSGGSGFTISASSGATLTGAVADAHGAPVLFAQPWDATRYMANPPLIHQVITSSTSLQRDMDHLVVMAVSPSGGAQSTVNPVAATGGTLIAAAWPGTQVLIASRANGAQTLTSARLGTDGALAQVTVDKGETLLAAGTTLVADGRSYVTVTGAPATVVVGGAGISATGPDGNSYRVYAPQPITTVEINGSIVGSCRDGDEVVFPCTSQSIAAQMPGRSGLELCGSTGVATLPWCKNDS